MNWKTAMAFGCRSTRKATLTAVRWVVIIASIGCCCSIGQVAAQKITSATGSNTVIWGEDIWMSLSDVMIVNGELISARVPTINCAGHPTSFSNMGPPGKVIALRSDILQNGFVQSKLFGPIKVQQTERGLFSTEVGQPFQVAFRKFCK